MTPEFHPAAARELSAAVQNGEEYSRGLGAELKAEAQRVTHLVLNTPLGRASDLREHLGLGHLPIVGATHGHAGPAGNQRSRR